MTEPTERKERKGEKRFSSKDFVYSLTHSLTHSPSLFCFLIHVYIYVSPSLSFGKKNHLRVHTDPGLRMGLRRGNTRWRWRGDKEEEEAGGGAEEAEDGRAAGIDTEEEAIDPM